jgi:outer membrane receptor protein involved in Fe transport
VHQGAVAPWILGAWRFKPGWAVKASAGGSRQFAELDEVLGLAGSSALVPERATHVDIGIEQRLSHGAWQATLFNREENDVLQQPRLQPRLVQGVVFDPPSPGEYRNALHGSARGVEMVVTSDHGGAISGWVSYTYAIARQTDDRMLETFWSDFDRRHALNAAGLFSIGHRASMGLVLRAGSGVPIPGYFDTRNGRLLVGGHRNSVRLAPYLRLDARAQRTFLFSRHAVTLFGEVLNVLNHHNEGIAEGIFGPGSGEAVGFTRPLLPRRAAIGIEVNLPR